MVASKRTRSLGLALLLVLIFLGSGRIAARAQSNSQVEDGARLYAENCAVCHGLNGEGRVGATLAKDWPSIRPDLTVRTIIQNGVPGSPMPAWSQAKGGPLSEAEIEAIVAYILSWGTGGAPQIASGPTPTSRPIITPLPDVQGDPNRGAVLFDHDCAVCHGRSGEGRIGATLSKNWPSIRPDLAVKATISNGVPNSQMPAWSQAKGGPLSEADINDLVAFILTLGETNPVVQVSPVVTTPPGTPSPLRGWAGAVLALVIIMVVVAAAILLQKNKGY